MLLLFPCLLSAQDGEGSGVFSNPVIPYNWADPTIWQDGDTFYTVATGMGTILSSRDLVDWENTRQAPLSPSARAEARKIGSHFWAPDMVKIGDKWMLYLTCYNSAEDSGIVAFESASATGPWEYVSLITHSSSNGIKDTIDPEVVCDPVTGKVWMFFGSVGKIHRVELDGEGRALAPGAEFVHVAGLDVNDNRSRSKVYEGAYLYRHDGYWYLFVSGGRYFDESYNVKVGRSRSLSGTFVDHKGRKLSEGYGLSFLKSEKGDDFFGPGHNGEIFEDKEGRTYILYHCHQQSTGRPNARYTLLQQVFWGKDGWPYVANGKPVPSAEAPAF